MWIKTAKVSIQEKYLKTSFTTLSNVFSNLNEISRKIQQLPCKKMHLRFVCKMAVILCGPQYNTCVQWLCLRQNSRHVSNWNVQLSYLKWIWNHRLQNIRRPYCLCLDVLTRCGRDKVTSVLKTTFSISFLTSGETWIRYKNLHTWNGSHVSVAMLCGRDKMVPLSRWYIQTNFPAWNCFIIFFQIWLKCISKFPYRNLLYHRNILLWEGINRRAQDMTSLLGNVFPNAGPMCGP